MHTSREGPTGPPTLFARMELLHESAQTRVSRLFVEGGSVIRKEVLAPDAEKRLRHETALVERLSGVEGVVQLAAGWQEPGSIMLADVGGVCLADRAMPVEVGELIRVALGLTRAVAAMHGRGVVHRDICPANIVVGTDGLPYLIDFALATTVAEIRPGFAHHTEIVGTLPYLAPEQTGRTGRPVDQRADLYSVGTTLYELATGAPPFGTGDPLRLIHDHLTRMPTPPTEVNRAVPPALSAIIMHLLEKEPDDRYQSAEGLIHDLAQLVEGDARLLRVGERDFPMRLLAPSRLFGRDAEIAALHVAFAEAMAGRSRGLLVSGAPGVGKTSLVNELRPIVTANDGWFVMGKFDQYRRDQEFDGVAQAFRALGRLLLAEPEEELAKVRARLLRSLGQNAGLITAVIPEFATILQVPPDMGDPQTAQVRAQRNAVQTLRAIASRKRPIVVAVDDVQWAGRTPLGFIDAVFSGDEEVEGLLLVGAYREGEVDATHPLTPMLSRWERQQIGPTQLRLSNLPDESLTAMVADMLRLDPGSAADLAHLIAPRTHGNPYETVELLNALRHEGVLLPGADGWRWDAAALRAGGRSDVAELLAERADGVPSPTRALLDVMACLAGRVELSLMQVATETRADELEQQLAPALADGLLVVEPGAVDLVVRFRHDRVQEAVLRRMGQVHERTLRLHLARRLGERPELFAVAAEQYLPVVDAVRDPGERRRAATLFQQAAEQAKLLSNHPLVQQLLGAAAQLVDHRDLASLIKVLTGRLTALYSLARFDEADDVYRTIDRLCTDPRDRADAVLVQVSSLTNRGRPQEALGLGVEQLRRLGVAVPTPERLDAEIERGLDVMYQWLDETNDAYDLQRPEITDERLLAVAALINRMMPPAFFSDHQMMCWLTLDALRMWAEDGPGPTLVGPASHIAFVTALLRDDYRAGYEAMRRILAVSQARGYEPHASQARFLYALGTDQWFEPLEDGLGRAQEAREGLIQGGDLQNACWTYYSAVYEFFDCAASLKDYLTEVESALAFARRTGNEHAAEMYRAYRRLVDMLRGEAGPTPVGTQPALAGLASNPLAVTIIHITRALGAAILDLPAELDRHADAAIPTLPFIGPTYPAAIAHLLRALALADRIRAAAPPERDRLLDELDRVVEWLAARTADAPANFAHLLLLAEAERAWATGDFGAAVRAFDTARREVATRQRPWHRALITERAARFYLANGIEQAGYELLVEAREEYLAWGATAKVNQLDWAYPTLTRHDAGASDAAAMADRSRRASIPVGTIDVHGVLAASRVLSSETSIDGLRARVVEVLSALTGATVVHLLLWNSGEHRWHLVGPHAGSQITPVDDLDPRVLPQSVVRYAERTGEPVIVDDAARDDRFARDPYFIDIRSCSLLALPIYSRGFLQALLLLENRLLRGAFSAERLDAALLITGQLAVSLDNAFVYASLERKVAERTQQLAAANERLEKLSVTDMLTGLPNRRGLEEVLQDEWRHATENHRTIAFAMVDIDHFKLYNDHYGHAAGDRCLQRVATELSENLRDSDVIARYGGEEFALVMPDTDITAATRCAEQLRQAVVKLAAPHIGAKEQIVTVSIGVAATIPSPDSGPDRLVDIADVELYRAKRSGRNQVRGAVGGPDVAGRTLPR
jgi:diguanylate cyclase (GGDEF)-like protein